MTRRIQRFCLAILFALGPVSAQAQTNELGGLVDRLTGADRNPDEARIDAASDKAIADPGRTVRWRNPATGHSGTVTVTGAYRSEDGYDCLDYRRVTATGSGRVAHEGAFCRQIFGWARASEHEVSASKPAPKRTASAPSGPDPDIRRVQAMLADLGYDPGPADGLQGPRTRAAIRAYQDDRGLRTDGRASVALVRRLERDGGHAQPVPPPGGSASVRHVSVGGGAGRRPNGTEEAARSPFVSPRPPIPYPGTPLPHSPLPQRQEIASVPSDDVLPPHDRMAPPLDPPKTAQTQDPGDPSDVRVAASPLRPGLLAAAEPPSTPAAASRARLEDTGGCVGCSLRDADLTDLELAKTELADADLAGSVLDGVWADFADLRRAGLSGARLRDAQLWKALLTGADLRGAVLDGADLSGADLADADLCHATLRGADLRGANLSDARVEGADFRDARLARADLTGVDMSGATIAPDALDDAVLCGTLVSGQEIDTGCETRPVKTADPPEIVAVPATEAATADGRP